MTPRFGASEVQTAKETEEFDEWARLAASIGQYSRDVEQVPSPKANRPANGHKNGRSQNGAVKVERLPNFLLKGPAIDEEGDELDRGSDQQASQDAHTAPPAKTAVPEPAPYLLKSVLTDDLDIPSAPANSLAMDDMSMMARAAAFTPSRVASPKVRGPDPTAKSMPVTGKTRASVARQPVADETEQFAEVKAAKRVGVTAPVVVDRREASRRRLERRMRRGAMLTVSGVTIGGAAVAIIYILVLATTSIF